MSIDEIAIKFDVTYNLIDACHCFLSSNSYEIDIHDCCHFLRGNGINLGQLEPTTCSLPQRPSHRFLHQNPISLRFIKISTKFLVGSTIV